MIHHVGQVHQVAGAHLGDTWASLNYYHQQSSLADSVVFIHAQRALSEAHPLLAGPGTILLTKSPPTVAPVPYNVIFRIPYYPTHTVWEPSDSKTVCFQFDGRFGAEHKNPSRDELRDFLSRTRQAGFVPMNLGGRPLAEGIKLLAQAMCFVGILSGWTEVCTSVGTPIHMVVNGSCPHWVKTIFRHRRRYAIYRRLPDVLMTAKGHLADPQMVVPF
jgi:hypothetical protein